MCNPFVEVVDSDCTEYDLINRSLKGDLKALEKVILCHQAWIYNIALRMVCDPSDAEDITQEILLKIVTKLSQFNSEKSSFRTWLYRIVVNHVLTMKRSNYERLAVSFEEYHISKAVIKNQVSLPDQNILVEELKIGCYLGSLLCFNRKERLVFILGAIFEIKSSIGAAIMDISHDNFRKILSRSKIKLSNFVNQKCGLLNKNNPCQCSNQLIANIDSGWLNPNKLVFHKGSFQMVRDVVHQTIDDTKLTHYRDLVDLFRNHPFYTDFDFTKKVAELIKDNQFKSAFHLRDP